MFISENKTRDVIDIMMKKHHANMAIDYDEPGYDSPESGVILADWNNVPRYLADYLESAGFELEWIDEWIVDEGMAYRTSPNSYSWQPTAVILPDECDVFTPECDAGDVIEALTTENYAQIKAVPYWISDAKLQQYGYILYESDLELGLHTGQTDDPQKIARELLESGKAESVVGRIDENSQVYSLFSIWYRPNKFRRYGIVEKISSRRFSELVQNSVVDGYPIFFICADGGVLSHAAARQEADLILDVIRDDEVGVINNENDYKWRVVGYDVNWKDEELYCAHTGERIPPVYGNDDDER